MHKNITYSIELAEEICATVATTNKGLVVLCKENEHWPDSSTVYNWRIRHHDFREMYSVAKKHQIEVLVDEIISIADDKSNDFVEVDGRLVVNRDHINRDRLRIDVRKWLASKLVPKMYGDKTVEERTETHEQALRELAGEE